MKEKRKKTEENNFYLNDDENIYAPMLNWLIHCVNSGAVVCQDTYGKETFTIMNRNGYEKTRREK